MLHLGNVQVLGSKSKERDPHVRFGIRRSRPGRREKETRSLLLQGVTEGWINVFKCDCHLLIQDEVEIKGTVTGALLFLLFLLLRPGAADEAPHCQQKAAQKCRFLHTAPATRHLFPFLNSSSPNLSLSANLTGASEAPRAEGKKIKIKQKRRNR